MLSGWAAHLFILIRVSICNSSRVFLPVFLCFVLVLVSMGRGSAIVLVDVGGCGGTGQTLAFGETLSVGPL